MAEELRFSNLHNLPLPIAIFLASNDYDGYKEGKAISATGLLRSVRQTILSSRIEARCIDVSSLIAARMGSAYHSAIEQSLLSPRLNEVLASLGVKSSLAINPSGLEEIPQGAIPVYVETRTEKDFLGWTISGKFDLIFNGVVEDFKSTSVYTYLNQNNRDKYILQGSIYRWLNPALVTKDYMRIHYLFTDWSVRHAKQIPQRILSQEFPLLSLQETEQYISRKLKELDIWFSKPEEEIPPCSGEELWRRPSKWKYFSSETSQRSSKNFDDSFEAQLYLSQKKYKGLIREVPGEVIACRYCPAFALCSQKDRYLASGELKL